MFSIFHWIWDKLGGRSIFTRWEAQRSQYYYAFSLLIDVPISFGTNFCLEFQQKWVAIKWPLILSLPTYQHLLVWAAFTGLCLMTSMQGKGYEVVGFPSWWGCGAFVWPSRQRPEDTQICSPAQLRSTGESNTWRHLQVKAHWQFTIRYGLRPNPSQNLSKLSQMYKKYSSHIFYGPSVNLIPFNPITRSYTLDYFKNIFLFLDLSKANSSMSHCYSTAPLRSWKVSLSRFLCLLPSLPLPLYLFLLWLFWTFMQCKN